MLVHDISIDIMDPTHFFYSVYSISHWDPQCQYALVFHNDALHSNWNSYIVSICMQRFCGKNYRVRNNNDLIIQADCFNLSLTGFPFYSVHVINCIQISVLLTSQKVAASTQAFLIKTRGGCHGCGTALVGKPIDKGEAFDTSILFLKVLCYTLTF